MASLYQEHLEKIMRFVRTREDADMLLEGVELLESALYKADKDIGQRIIKEHFSHRMGAEVRALMDAAAADASGQGLKVALAELRGLLKGLVVLKIDVAYPPSEAALDGLHEWVMTNVGKDIILDIGVDRSLEGGVRMIWRGRYREISLVQMIRHVVERERETIMRELGAKK